MAATCLLLLPLIVAIVVSARQTRLEREHEIRSEAGSVAVTAAAYLDEYLRGLDALASGIVRHPDVIGLNDEACNELFAAVLSDQPLLTNVTLVDPQGRIHGSALSSQDGRLSRPWFVDVVETGRPQVGELALGALSGKLVLTLAYPVTGGAALTGVLGLYIDLTQLQNVFAAIPLPVGSVITVVDQAGRILARSADPGNYLGKVTIAATASGSSAERLDVDGVERFTGESQVHRAPWILTVGIPVSIVNDRLWALQMRNLAIFVSLAIGSVLLALSLVWLVSRRLNHLRGAAQRIAGGDLAPVVTVGMPSLELSELQDSFVRMAASLREMRDSHDRQVTRERSMNDALQSLQRQVVRQERLAAVGLLASGVAHELNNPLQAIVGAAELLERQAGLSSQAKREIGIVKAQGTRASEIIRSLSRFGSQRSGPIVDLDLRDIVDEVMRFDTRDNGSAVDIVARITSSRNVCASFTEIEQVVLNFLQNARQAVEVRPRGERHIELRLFDAGERVRLEVLDNGHGVSTEDEAKLFQPFFTTRAVGDGPGLGLSVSYGIVHSYGGDIGYSRNEWGGATFYFELPVADIPAGVS